MTLAQIQRQLTLNRKALADLYRALDIARNARKQWSDSERMKRYATEDECKAQAYSYHKESVKLVPKIAAIVELQKSLKKSYQQALSLQRAGRLVANGWLKGHLEAAKKEAEEKGKATREAAQLNVGEFY